VLSVATNGPLQLPSTAALASKDWRDVSDNIALQRSHNDATLLILFKYMHEVIEEGKERYGELLRTTLVLLSR